MTVDPATVTPATSLKYVADLLVTQKVSAVPVASLRGKVLDVIAETDLVRKEELQREPDARHSVHLFSGRRSLPDGTIGPARRANPAMLWQATGRTRSEDAE
jgi:hypothetical protein